MVEEDIRCRGIRDQRVLQVLATLPRHLFVPEDIRRFAYEESAAADWLRAGHFTTLHGCLDDGVAGTQRQRASEICTAQAIKAAVTRRIKRRSVFC